MVLEEEIYMPCASHIMVTFPGDLNEVETEFAFFKMCKDAACSSLYGSNPVNGFTGSGFYETFVSGPRFFIDFTSDDAGAFYGFDLVATPAYGMNIYIRRMLLHMISCFVLFIHIYTF